MTEQVHLRYNVPLQIALTGDFEIHEQTNQVSYSLTDGRELTVPHHVAVQINTLDPAPGEPFFIVKQEAETRTEWQCWLSPVSEKARAISESENLAAETQADLGRQLERSLRVVQGRKRLSRKPPTIEQPRLFDQEKGTGTFGPATQPKVQSRPAPPMRCAYPDALRHVTRTVVSVLKELGEQWNDAAKQDLISTLLIAATKQNLVVFEFPAEEER